MGIETERQGAERLLETLARVQTLKVGELRATPRTSDGGVDFVVDVAVGKGRPWTLVCVVKANPRPSVARMAVVTLISLLHRWPGRTYGVLVVPLLSEQTRMICADHGVGCLDLTGNCLLSFDTVHIERWGRKPPPSPKRLYPALFGTKSERLLRLLFHHPGRSWTVQDLAEQAEVSVGLVSKVRRALLENGWARAGEDGLRLTAHDALIDAWRAAYRRPKDWRGFYTDLRGPDLQDVLRRVLEETGQGAHAVLAGASAAQWLAPYVTGSMLELYADGIGLEALSHCLRLRGVSRGANVLVAMPKDEGVFLDRCNPAPRLWCTSPVQTYLDLAAAGDRHVEAAEHLRRERLQPLFQEARP